MFVCVPASCVAHYHHYCILSILLVAFAMQEGRSQTRFALYELVRIRHTRGWLRAFSRFLVVLPSHSIVFPMARAFAFAVAAMVLAASQIWRNIFFSLG